MPKKYHVTVRTLAPRHSPVSKYASFETTRCLNCRRCVKYTACVYNAYDKRAFDPEQVQDTLDFNCVMCFRCVQECKNNILTRAPNPRFTRMGDDYWTADTIARIWKQAETGKIPVSGAGYRGPFCGPGFDQMWTDMSEIVRPTRDGIHGREYISTVIELGRKPERLAFDNDGNLLTEPPPFLEISIPLVLDIPPFGFIGEGTRRAMAMAAGKLGTVAVATAEEAAGVLAEFKDRLIVRLDPERDDALAAKGAALIELIYSDGTPGRIAALKKADPAAIVSVRLVLDENAAQRALALTRQGADVIHLHAGPQGNGLGKNEDKFITTLVREVHLQLVAESLRDQVTLLASGGIGLAEHVAKIIICGADGAGIDLAMLAALECRLCPDCEEQAECPVELDTVEEQWGAQRIVNLVGAWHSQLIEVMGAMGLREVRRLRGEVGRAMFFEDLERETFAPIFGERKAAALSSGNPGWDAARRAEEPAPAPVPPPPRPAEYAEPPEGAQITRSRYRNRLSKYKVVLTNDCNQCGKCVEACRYGVLEKHGGFMATPRSDLCRGAAVCKSQGSLCIDACPVDAIRVGLNPEWNSFGDPRWTSDLIVSTWLQAQTGMPPVDSGLEYKVGASGGGFDRLEFAFPAEPPEPSIKLSDIDLSIPLNRRGDERPEVTIGMPVYGGGMSFGSISLATIISRARAYQSINSFTCTGEGGYPDALNRYDDHVITQVATGLFGVREETIQRVRIVEFKYAQGAKPGLGGHLLGDKVTPAVAKMREAVEGSSLFSPFPFHSVYSVEDHKKHVDWIKVINPRALVSVKVSTPSDVEMVAVGSYYAGAHILHLDGSYGGTGAAPDIAKKNIAMPIEYAIPKVHRFLIEEGVREQMTLIASGGLRTAWDVAKAIALGADGVVIGTAEMVALECIRCGNCESGRGCPRGIATTDPELSTMYDSNWGSRRLINLFHSWSLQLREILWRLGMKSIRELTGRSDVLVHLDYLEKSA
ncbi:MAG TPA: glutamate synthase-related protein [bacterium]|nr:glutamate synthase-related protein [bacterium]